MHHASFPASASDLRGHVDEVCGLLAQIGFRRISAVFTPFPEEQTPVMTSGEAAVTGVIQMLTLWVRTQVGVVAVR